MISRVAIYNNYFDQFINLLKFRPKKVNNIHKDKDKKTLKKAIKNLLLTNRSTVSNEKAEKVVKDPRIPIIKKYLIKS